MAGSLDGKRPGRKPLPPDKRLVRVTAYITAEQEAYCKSRGNGSAVRGLKELIRLAMAGTGGETPSAGRCESEPEESPAAVEHRGRRKGDPGPYPQLCDRCARVGPACDHCIRVVREWNERQTRRS